MNDFMATYFHDMLLGNLVVKMKKEKLLSNNVRDISFREYNIFLAKKLNNRLFPNFRWGN